MKKQIIKLGVLFSLAGLVWTACDKSETSDAPSFSAEEIILAQDDISVDEVYTDIDAGVQEKLAELEANAYQPVSTKSGIEDDFTCLEITVDHPDSTRFPKVVTFDYGSGCRVIFNGDTIFREGKIMVTLTDHFMNPGAQHIVTFEDFYQNEKKVEGILTNTYNGINGSGYPEFHFTLEQGKLIFADEDGNRLEYTREADFIKEWDRERVPVEDTLYINGSMWGTNTEDVDYSREIIETLVLVHCPGYGRRWVIVDGQVLNTRGDEETITDFSEGGCDGTAMIRHDGQHHRIRVHERHRHRYNGN